MKRPQPGKNPKADEDEGKSPVLESFRKLKFREFEQVESVRAGLGPCDHIGCDQSDKDHGTSDKRIEHELHRAILPSRRTPDRDQKIFRDDGQLVEHEEQKKIEADKHTVDATDQRKVKAKEFPGAM